MLVIAAINLQLVSCTATLKNHVWMEGGAVILKLRHRSGREYVNYPRTGNSWFTTIYLWCRTLAERQEVHGVTFGLS